MNKTSKSKNNQKSTSTQSENRKKLKAMFPEVFTDEHIRLNELEQVFGKIITDETEPYGLYWKGKDDADRLSSTPTTFNLKPSPEESRDWDKTENLYLEGDNLEALKLMKESYTGKIKLIYIDPPYNTGKDFVYKDKHHSGKSISLNPGLNTKPHTDWLNMIYPRLNLAKDLLSDEGFIFISINDNEVHNLRQVCDEVFGENAFISNIIIKSNPGGRDYGGIALTHDYLLVYSRKPGVTLNLVSDKSKVLPFQDSVGEFELREIRNRNIRFNDRNRPNLHYPFYVNKDNMDDNGLYEISLEKVDGWVTVYPKVSQGVNTVWRWGKDKARRHLNTDLKAKQKRGGGFQIVEKYRKTTKRERSIWDESNIRNEAGGRTLKEVFDGKYNPFDYPKSVHLITRILNLSTNKDSLVLDFFSGSATTAHAVMKLNAEDGGNRKFIMVQMAEAVPKKSEAFRNGFKTVSEIGKERIRRVGDKIKQAYPESCGSIDIGFKVYKIEPISMND
jgi:adenine-specific DNA-methyltransferase